MALRTVSEAKIDDLRLLYFNRLKQKVKAPAGSSFIKHDKTTEPMSKDRRRGSTPTVWFAALITPQNNYVKQVFIGMTRGAVKVTNYNGTRICNTWGEVQEAVSEFYGMVVALYDRQVEKIENFNRK